MQASKFQNNVFTTSLNSGFARADSFDNDRPEGRLGSHSVSGSEPRSACLTRAGRVYRGMTKVREKVSRFCTRLPSYLCAGIKGLAYGGTAGRYGGLLAGGVIGAVVGGVAIGPAGAVAGAFTGAGIGAMIGSTCGDIGGAVTGIAMQHRQFNKEKINQLESQLADAQEQDAIRRQQVDFLAQRVTRGG